MTISQKYPGTVSIQTNQVIQNALSPLLRFMVRQDANGKSPSKINVFLDYRSRIKNLICKGFGEKFMYLRAKQLSGIKVASGPDIS